MCVRVIEKDLVANNTDEFQTYSVPTRIHLPFQPRYRIYSTAFQGMNI